MSHEEQGGVPDEAALQQLVGRLRAAGGHIARLVTNPADITDSLRMLALLQKKEGGLA